MIEIHGSMGQQRCGAWPRSFNSMIEIHAIHLVIPHTSIVYTFNSMIEIHNPFPQERAPTWCPFNSMIEIRQPVLGLAGDHGRSAFNSMIEIPSDGDYQATGSFTGPFNSMIEIRLRRPLGVKAFLRLSTL